jgi:hypothetical protein
MQNVAPISPQRMKLAMLTAFVSAAAVFGLSQISSPEESQSAAAAKAAHGHTAAPPPQAADDFSLSGGKLAGALAAAAIGGGLIAGFAVRSHDKVTIRNLQQANETLELPEAPFKKLRRQRPAAINGEDREARRARIAAATHVRSVPSSQDKSA